LQIDLNAVSNLSPSKKMQHYVVLKLDIPNFEPPPLPISVQLCQPFVTDESTLDDVESDLKNRRFVVLPCSTYLFTAGVEGFDF
jgi:hypothetical protein